MELLGRLDCVVALGYHSVGLLDAAVAVVEQVCAEPPFDLRWPTQLDLDYDIAFAGLLIEKEIHYGDSMNQLALFDLLVCLSRTL